MVVGDLEIATRRAGSVYSFRLPLPGSLLHIEDGLCGLFQWLELKVKTYTQRSRVDEFTQTVFGIRERSYGHIRCVLFNYPRSERFDAGNIFGLSRYDVCVSRIEVSILFLCSRVMEESLLELL